MPAAGPFQPDPGQGLGFALGKIHAQQKKSRQHKLTAEN
jgi:hypothetical protein